MLAHDGAMAEFKSKMGEGDYQHGYNHVPGALLDPRFGGDRKSGGQGKGRVVLEDSEGQVWLAARWFPCEGDGGDVEKEEVGEKKAHGSGDEDLGGGCGPGAQGGWGDGLKGKAGGESDCACRHERPDFCGLQLLEGWKEVRRPPVDEAEDPASLLIARGDKGHAHSGDDPEGDDAESRAQPVGGDGDLHCFVNDRKAQDDGGNDGEAHAAIEDEIDAIARDAQKGLADEVEDGAADWRADDGGVEEGVERAVRPGGR